MKALALFDAMASSGLIPADNSSSGLLRAAIVELVENTKASAGDQKKLNRLRAKDAARQKRKRAQKKVCISIPPRIDSQIKKERKRPPMQELSGDLFGNMPAVKDDWPDDFDIQFWDAWPRHPRKHSQKQVADKLARIRRDGGIIVRKKLVPVTWAQIWGGLTAYVASKPEHKFIPAPLVWLHGQRWLATYDQVAPVKPTFGDIMRGGVARHG